MKESINIFTNERVSASAGSGKTHSLTSRFIALAEYERNSENLPDPTGIIALTFTKKSAGEFLSKILTRLACAIEDETQFEQLSNSIYKISKRHIDKDSIQTLLEQAVKNIDKLKLSTIDSFFSSVLRVFTNEIGVFTPMQLMDNQTQADSQKKIIESILDESDFRDSNFKNFIEILKRKSGSAQWLSLNATLQKAVIDAIYFKQNQSEQISFGDYSIFNKALVKWDKSAYEAEISELKNLLASTKINANSIETIINNFKQSNDNDIKFSSKIIEQFVYAYAENIILSEVLIRNKPIEISSEIYLLVNSLLTRIHDAHIAKYFSASNTMNSILEKFEDIYYREIIANGMLTFSDISQLLNSCPKTKELLEYRLDAKFNHWLFDEFQDTSRTQWKFFASIIDRIINPQDGDNDNKTFYYVGDIKQSIYSWRGGDKQLFKEIFQQYQNDSKHPIIQSSPLTKSFRSHANIIRIVNEIFNKQEPYCKYIKDTFTQMPTEEFLEIFEPHSFNNKDSQPTSISQLRVVKKVDKNQHFYDQILDIINEVKPSKKSIAILVSKNDQIKDICDYLKSKNIQVAPEGKKTLAQNNMLATGFIHFLKHLAHPKDTASLEYLKMTSFAKILEDKDYKTKSLIYLSTGKYANFLKNIYAKIEVKSNNFQELLQACTDFENSKKRGIDKLINFLENEEITLSSNSNFVQVMTIHKSKGLEFSVVILPHLDDLTSVKFNGLQTIENNGKSTISYMPNEAIISMNKSLQDTKLKHKNNAMFENICKLYVALTRAENALYILLNEPKEKYSKIGTLLSESFFRAKTQDIIETEDVDIYNVGNAKWYTQIKEKNKEKPQDNSAINTIKNPSLIESTLETISPSKVNISDTKSDKNALAFGCAIHKVLEQIKFIENDINSTISQAISLANIEDNLVDRIDNLLKKLFANAQIKAIFEKSKSIEVFNEFDFISEIDSDIITGQIDRLMLKKDKLGNIVSAIIIDYKSTYNASQNQQLTLYKKAIQSIYNLDSTQVSTQVIGYLTCLVTIL